MDHWNRFALTGDVREYLAYRAEEDRAGRSGEKYERTKLYGDRHCAVCHAGKVNMINWWCF